MPESFNDRSPTPSASPKPARTGGSQGAMNASPSAKGAPGGGLDSPRANTQTFAAGDARATTSPLKATRAPVDTFNDASV